MAWFWVDDKLHDHHKARRAGVEAMGLWVLAGSWCAEQRSAGADGFVPADVAFRWGGRRTEQLADRLVDAGGDDASGLWVPATVRGETGWEFHDWTGPDGTGWQKPLDVLEGERAAARERMRKVRAARKTGGQGAANADRTPPPGSEDVRPNNPRTGDERSGDVRIPLSVSLTHDSLLTLVCRRLSSGTRETTTDAELSAWTEWVGAADLDDELRSWLIYNADVELRNPAASLQGWLKLAAERAGRQPLGCRECESGWLGEDPETGAPRPCPTCRPNVVPTRGAS